MRHLAVLASLCILAACPSSSEPGEPPTPETPLSELSAENLRSICNEEVARLHDDLALSFHAFECVSSALTDNDPATCDAAVLDPCLADLPATTDVNVICVISDPKIEALQECEETTAQTFRACLAARAAIDASLPEVTCDTLAGLVDDWDLACEDAEASCPAMKFEYLDVR
jgi:hypothetical protein